MHVWKFSYANAIAGLHKLERLLNIRNLKPYFFSCRLQVQWILQCIRQYERIALCLHLCIYLFPFLSRLARWKTTDFSEEFSGLNIWSLMLLGEHGSAERRRAVAAIQGRRTHAFFLQFSSSMPTPLCIKPHCVFLTVRPFTAVCRAWIEGGGGGGVCGGQKASPL